MAMADIVEVALCVGCCRVAVYVKVRALVDFGCLAFLGLWHPAMLG